MAMSVFTSAHRFRGLAFGVLCSAVFFVLAAAFEWSERLSAWFSANERWQVDEIALTLAFLAAALAWYAVRRSRAALQAETHVATLLLHNRAMAQRLILAQEAERGALARELHDEVGQNCSAIRAEASFIRHAGPADREAIGECAVRIDAAAAALHALVRSMLRQLRPPALDSLGLEPALQELCEYWQQQHRVACRFSAADVPARLGEATSIAIYRLVQEALTNVARHAGATQVSIHLAAREQEQGQVLALTIEDDGCGIADPARAWQGFGLSGMRERVLGLSGTIRWRPARSRGVRIDVVLPGVAVAA